MNHESARNDVDRALAAACAELDMLVEAVCNPEWHAEQLRSHLCAAGLQLAEVGISDEDIADLCREAHIRYGKLLLSRLEGADWPVQILWTLRDLLYNYRLELSDLDSTEERVEQLSTAAFRRSIPKSIVALRDPSVGDCVRRQVIQELMLALRKTGQTYRDVGCTQEEIELATRGD